MTTLHRTRMAASALVGVTAVGAGIAAWAAQAHAAGGFYDAAYGISSTGAARIGPTPAVSSPNGLPRSDFGGAGSSDGTVSVETTFVKAGGGKASATVTGFTAFGDLVRASTVAATCSNGAATSHVSGTPAGRLGKKGTIAYDVRVKNSDGSTTVVGMQIRISAAAGTQAATINVASATCAALPDRPTPPGPTATGTATAKPTAVTATSSATATRTNSAPARTPGTGQADPNTQPRHEGQSGTLSLAPVPTPRATHLPVTG